MTIPAERTSRPLRADAERNRRRILAAAREVFARRGLDAGLDEIARHAGVGTGTVYRRFPDKELLVEALFAERFDQLLALAEEAAECPDPWDGLVRLLESSIQMQIDDRGLTDLCFGRMGDDDVFRDRPARILPVFEQVLQRARAAGGLRPDIELTDLACLQYMLTQMTTFAGPVHPDLWRRYLRLVLDGLRTTRPGPSPLEQPPLSLDGFEAACRRPHGVRS